MRPALMGIIPILNMLAGIPPASAADKISFQPASGVAASWPREVADVSWDGQLILYYALHSPGNSSTDARLFLYDARTQHTVQLSDHYVIAALARYGHYVFMSDYFTSPGVIAIVDLIHGTRRDEAVPGSVTGSIHASADGRYVTWTGDGDPTVVADNVNPFYSFWHDTVTHATKLVEPVRISSGIGISGDGQWVGVFGGGDGNPYDLYLSNPTTGTNIPVATSAADVFTGINTATPGFSLDFGGTFLAYSAFPVGGFSGIQQIHVFNRVTRHDEMVSTSPGGALGNGDSTQPTLSNDGRFVAFASTASNLTPGVADHRSRIYVCDRWLRKTWLITSASGGDASRTWYSTSPLIDANARHVVFNSSPDAITGQYFTGPVNIFESCLPGEPPIVPAGIETAIAMPHGNG